MNKHRYTIIASCLFISLISSCVSLNHGEKMKVAEIKRAGLSETEKKVKEPFVAGSLSLLPGVGNFYLGTGTKYPGQWLYGGLNLITWPYSIAWALPQVVIDANSINKKKTVEYYRTDAQAIRRLRLRSNNFEQVAAPNR